MRTGYTIYVYSPSLNEEHRWFDLTNTAPTEDERTARLQAESAAYMFNQQRKNNAQDWEGIARLESVGIETLDGYLFHTGG